MIHKRSTTLERSIKIVVLEGLNKSHGTNMGHMTFNEIPQYTYFAKAKTKFSPIL